MSRRRRLVAFAALLVGLVAAARAVAGDTPAPHVVLPDLVQAAPSAISVVTASRAGRTVQRLAFASAVENRGEGDLILAARRATRRQSLMTAAQLIERVDAAGRPVADRRVANVGRLHFVRLSDHSHWHFIGFERYELRSPVTGRLVARDRKSGFCVGNRYPVVPGAVLPPRAGQFDDNCGKSRPDLLRVLEGLSPGFADDYKPNLEGQFIDITKVPSGRYLLVHRTNADGLVREARRSNNAASVRLQLRRSRGRPPAVTVLRTCPDSPTCG